MERSLLSGLLSVEFPGVEALRSQVDWVEAKRGCECGCGTIDFVVTRPGLPPSDATSPVPVTGQVTGASGEHVGGLILFLQAGYLSSLEIYAYDDPLPLPNPQSVRWESS